MLGIVYWQGTSHDGSIPDNVSTAIKVATSGGTVIGQVGFGMLADIVGMRSTGINIKLLPLAD